MSVAQTGGLVLEVLGGLALFIFGMSVMTEALRKAAGPGLRSLLARATRRKSSALALGTGLGCLVQSSAATVTLVGLIHAGLLSLAQSVPMMLGANLGTTLAMQVISFRLGAYAFVAVVVGLALQTGARPGRRLYLGRTLFGFGLLLLGMNLMSGAVRPHREALAPLLARVDGRTWSGMLTGVAAATLVTAVLQSSGATIGMVFAMIGAGIVTRLEQAYPVIIGANIGTCATALLGSVGTGIEARRSAVSHLLFNLYSALLGILAAPLLFRWLPAMSSDVLRQAANANTLKMAASVLLAAPLTGLHTRLVCRLTPTRRPAPRPSFLVDALLARPSRALRACMREVERALGLCLNSLRMDARLFFEPDRRVLRRIKNNERSVNEIKAALRRYLRALAGRPLARRQALMLLHVNRCMNHVERTGDHLDEIADLTSDRLRRRRAAFDERQLETLFGLHGDATAVLTGAAASLQAGPGARPAAVRRLREAQCEYAETSADARLDLARWLAARRIRPLAALYLRELIGAFDRAVRHTRLVTRRLDSSAPPAPATRRSQVRPPTPET